jgi:hypothetical protein
MKFNQVGKLGSNHTLIIFLRNLNWSSKQSEGGAPLRLSVSARKLLQVISRRRHGSNDSMNVTTQPLAKIATFYPDPKGLSAAASRQGIVTISIIHPFRAGVKMTEIFEN